LRNGETHGLLPYLSRITDIGITEYLVSIQALVRNIGFSAVIIKYTAIDAPEISLASILTSVNPLLSTSGWEALKPSLRTHLYIPYSAIGELYNFSPLLLYVFLLQLFSLIIFITRTLLINESSRPNLTILIHFAVALLACLYLLQYNLRSVMRLETIMIVNFVLYKLLADVKMRPK
jgi:hypothetical protein